jgi:hypothetical protein|tara:strand:+ start:1102 stop:1731 length:630 start_codon:yes stop_codon:yes gene_type:complete
MTTGEVLEDEYYEHEGAVDLCKGGGYEVEETAEEKELANISMEKWERYKTKFRPLEDQYMAKVDNMGSDASYDRIGGLAGNAMVAGAGSQIDAGNQAMFQGGINPNSGKFMGANSALMSKGSKVLSAAVNSANMGLGNEQISRMEGIVNIGQGQAAGAVKSLSDIASSSVDQANSSAENRYNNYAGNLEAIGTAGGMGLRTYMNPRGTP